MREPQLQPRLHIHSLADVREARHATQVEVAEKASLFQSDVSRLERRESLDEVAVGTVRRYVEALDGTLRLVADFEKDAYEIGGSKDSEVPMKKRTDDSNNNNDNVVRDLPLRRTMKQIGELMAPLREAEAKWEERKQLRPAEYEKIRERVRRTVRRAYDNVEFAIGDAMEPLPDSEHAPTRKVWERRVLTEIVIREEVARALFESRMFLLPDVNDEWERIKQARAAKKSRATSPRKRPKKK